MPTARLCRHAPSEIGGLHRELEELVGGEEPLDYSLDRVCWFGERVLWLSPTPEGPFKRLTTVLADRFDIPPWQGEVPEVVPHLKVGLAGHALGSTLSDAADDLAWKLPLNCRAGEVDVICGDRSHWEMLRRVFLKGE